MLKNFIFIFASILLFCGCNNDNISKKDCIKKGMKFKNKTILNYRTGKYENRFVCVK